MKRPDHVDNLGILAVLSHDKWIVHIVQERTSLCLVRSCHLAVRIFISHLVIRWNWRRHFSLRFFCWSVDFAKSRSLISRKLTSYSFELYNLVS